MNTNGPNDHQFERPITDDFIKRLLLHYPAKACEQIEGLLRPNLPEPAATPINNVPNAIRARLKQLYSDPNRTWEWDEGYWDWELSLRDAQEELACGICCHHPNHALCGRKAFLLPDKATPTQFSGHLSPHVDIERCKA